MTIQKLKNLSEHDFVARIWGNNVLDNQHTIPMTINDFLKHCTTCGGDWGRMLLTGIPRSIQCHPWDALHGQAFVLCSTFSLNNCKKNINIKSTTWMKYFKEFQLIGNLN